MIATVKGTIISNRKTAKGFMQLALGPKDSDGNQEAFGILAKKERKVGEAVEATGKVGDFMTMSSIQE